MNITVTSYLFVNVTAKVEAFNVTVNLECISLASTLKEGVVTGSDFISKVLLTICLMLVFTAI